MCCKQRGYNIIAHCSDRVSILLIILHYGSWFSAYTLWWKDTNVEDLHCQMCHPENKQTIAYHRFTPKGTLVMKEKSACDGQTLPCRSSHTSEMFCVLFFVVFAPSTQGECSHSAVSSNEGHGPLQVLTSSLAWLSVLGGKRCLSRHNRKRHF